MISSDFHVVFCPGVSIYVDTEVRREVEFWLADTSGGPTREVVDLYGEDITLIRDMVIAVASSTSVGRRRDREHSKQMREEIPMEDRE